MLENFFQSNIDSIEEPLDSFSAGACVTIKLLQINIQSHLARIQRHARAKERIRELNTRGSIRLSLDDTQDSEIEESEQLSYRYDRRVFVKRDYGNPIILNWKQIKEFLTRE